MKNALHRLALRMGWYKDVTFGLPLNVCRSVFGTYFFEGCYTPMSPDELFTSLYNWGYGEGEKAAPKDGDVLWKGEWRTHRSGLYDYRSVKYLGRNPIKWRIEKRWLPIKKEPLDGQLYGTNTVVTGLACDEFDQDIKEPDSYLEDRACRGWVPSVTDYHMD